MKYINSKQPQVWMIVAAIAATLTTVSAQSDTDLWLKRLPALRTPNGQSQQASRLSWDDVVRTALSPKDVCKAVKAKVKYSRDMIKEDAWRSGKDTWDKGQGDCEDYAAAVRDLCKKAGFKSEIYVFRSKTARAAHAVVVGGLDTTMWLSSNGSFEEIRSLDDVKDKVARDQGWWTPDVEFYKVENTETHYDPWILQRALIPGDK